MRLTTGNLILCINGIAIVAGIIATAAPIIREARRPAVTDPAELARSPSKSLRDREIETLVRAAFRNATEVSIDYEGSRQTAPARHLVVTDQQTLKGLATVFALGRNDSQLPPYPHAGITYTCVTFNGPYKPDFVFTSSSEIYFFSASDSQSGSLRPVRTQFAKAIADELGLVVERERR
jgi:hypothetical protein